MQALFLRKSTCYLIELKYFFVGIHQPPSRFPSLLSLLMEPAINTVVFFFHEKAWVKIEEHKADIANVFAQQV